MDGGKIHSALAAIMREVGAIGKGSFNQGQKFYFRGIDAVMNHLHPIFAAHGVVILPEVLEDRTEERKSNSGGNLIYRIIKIKFHFQSEDGSRVDSTVIGEGMDSGDKAANKAMAVALKYALTQMLLLPYDEVDPDDDSPPPSAPKAGIPVDAQKDLRKMLDKPAEKPPTNAGDRSPSRGPRDPNAKASEAQRKKLYAMSMAAKISDDEMKTIIKRETGKEHSSDLTMGEIQGLFGIVGDYINAPRQPGQDG